MKKNYNPRLQFFLLLCLSFYQLQVLAGDTKLHIATNKENYVASETVQFQVFLLNPSPNINNTLFVELLDCYGNKLARQMLPFNFNISSGNIALPQNNNAEFYILYCYVSNTKMMECSSTKKIFVQNKAAHAQNNTGNSIRVNYYFEGGSFVSESPNNILIRCVDENQNPVETIGEISDGKTGTYAVFETDKYGLAKITLNPEDKVRYFIVLKGKNGNAEITPLRFASATGITLNTAVTENSIVYTVISYSKAGEILPDYRIEAVVKGEIVYDAAISFSNGLGAVKEEVKKEGFPTGLITFRVLDKLNKIYAQRVIYNPVTTAKNNFISIIDTVNKRETTVQLPGLVSGKALINIRAADAFGAVQKDVSFVHDTDTGSISINDQLIAATDLPTGHNSLNENTNRYLSISGILTDIEKKPLKNKNVNLIILHKNLKKEFLSGKTDSTGKLQVDNLIFFDSVTVYYQLADKSENKNNVYMQLKVDPSADLVADKITPLNFMCTDSASANQSKDKLPKEQTLKQVIVTAEKKKTESEKYNDQYVSSQSEKTNSLKNEIDLIENPEAIDNRSIFTYIQGRIPSLRITTTMSGVSIQATNGGTVGVYLNDMELPQGGSLDFLSDLQIKDVAKIRYYSQSLKPKQLGGNPFVDPKALDAGDLFIYTKQGYTAEDKLKGLPKANLSGYNVDKPYIVPTIIPGNSESIFWKPNWSVESGQRIYIGLPATGIAKDYEIVIEGINTFLVPYRFTQKLVFN